MKVSKVREFSSRVWAVVCRKRHDVIISDEIRDHIELRTEKNLAAGMPLHEARASAARAFGHIDRIAEECRDARRFTILEQSLDDLRYGLRVLIKNPVFFTVTVAILALGIGANTAMFTVINAVILRPLPIEDPSSLLILSKIGPENATTFSYPAFSNLAQRAKTISGLAAVWQSSGGIVLPNANADPNPERVLVAHVSERFFSVVGISAAAGRAFLEDDFQGGSSPVVVISDSLWARRFGRKASAVGATVFIDGIPCTIIGVLRPGFNGVSVGQLTDIWMPATLLSRMGDTSAQRLTQDGPGVFYLFARKSKVSTVSDVRTELDGIFQARQPDVLRSIGASWPENRKNRFLATSLNVQPGGAGENFRFVATLKPLVSALWIVVGATLLIACANVAGLLLVRGSNRTREFGLRAALGATQSRLLRQLLIEGVILSAAGAVGGLFVSFLGASILIRQIQENAPLHLAPDWRVLTFIGVITLLTSILIGLIPAFRFSRINLLTALKDQAGGTTNASRLWWNRALIILQVATSLCLLTGSSLLVRSLQKLYSLDPGFVRENVLLFRVSLDKTISSSQSLSALRDILAELHRHPGVKSATLVMGGMGRGEAKFRFSVDGYVPPPGEELMAYFTFAGPSFFKTIGTPIIRGHDFSLEEYTINSTDFGGREVIINDLLAKTVFGSTDPIGKTIKFAGRPLTIVATVRDTKYTNLRSENAFQVYLPYFKNPLLQGKPFSEVQFQVLTTSSPAQLGPDLKPLVLKIDSNARLLDIQTMQDVIEQSLTQERTIAKTVGAFSGIALFLSSLGLYGTLAFEVSQRKREIGIRIALGAAPRDVLIYILRRGIILTLCGFAAGLCLVPISVRIISSRLYGVSAIDPESFCIAGVVLILAALIASWIPARRATKVDPVIALRAD